MISQCPLNFLPYLWSFIGTSKNTCVHTIPISPTENSDPTVSSRAWITIFSPGLLYLYVHQLQAVKCPSPEGMSITSHRRQLPLTEGNLVLLWAMSNHYLEKLGSESTGPGVSHPGSGDPKAPTTFPFLFFIQKTSYLPSFVVFFHNSLLFLLYSSCSLFHS